MRVPASALHSDFAAASPRRGSVGDGDETRTDVAVIRSDTPAAAAGVFTRNTVKAAPVVISQLTLRRGTPISAIVVNAGNANACTGAQGFRDALVMCTTAGDALDLDPSDVLVCSTGVIGRPMPMDRVVRGIRAAVLAMSPAAGGDVARAIMTTDTVAKVAVATFVAGGVTYTVGGTAKGAGMLHPDMATLLAFITTDAPIDAALLQPVLSRVTDSTFNCVTVDGDTSTNDTCILLANGAAGRRDVSRRDRARSQRSRPRCCRCATRSPSSSSPTPRARRGTSGSLSTGPPTRSGARRRPGRRAEPACEDGHPRRRPQLGPHRRGPRPQRRHLHARSVPGRHRRCSSSSIAARPNRSTASASAPHSSHPRHRHRHRPRCRRRFRSRVGLRPLRRTTCASTPTTPPDTEQPPQPPCLNRPSTSGSIAPRCSSKHCPTSSGSPGTSSSSRSAVRRAPRPTSTSVLEDVVLLRFVGMRPVIVHGGGPEISAWQERMGIETRFVDGLRVTDAPTMEIAKMVLTGKIGPDIVARIHTLGARGDRALRRGRPDAAGPSARRMRTAPTWVSSAMSRRSTPSRSWRSSTRGASR